MSGIHLAISMCVAAFSLILVFWIWHPDPLQIAVGVTSIFVLMLAVDVTLGPLLTLLVASSPTKKTLKFDLAVIVLLQIGAYLYGMHTIAISRPVYIAFDNVRFEVVQADTVTRVYGEVAPEYRTNPFFSAQWVAIRPYEDAAEQQRRMQLEFTEAIAPSMQAHLYQPIDDTTWQQIKSKKSDLDTLPTTQREAIKHQYPTADGYLPLKTPTDVEMVVVVDTVQQQILDMQAL